MVVNQPPTSVASGATFGNITVSLQDKYGNVRTNDATVITASVGGGSGWTLEGTKTATPTAGVATFNSLSPKNTSSDGSAISNATIKFEGGSKEIVSNPFTVQELVQTVIPSFTNTLVTKTATPQPSVEFALSSPRPDGAWKVYADDNSATTPMPDITPAPTENGTKLTLSHITDIPAGEYFVSLTETGKSESDRVKLTVEPFTPDTQSKKPSATITEQQLLSTTQTSVTFILSEAITGTWAVYDNNSTTTPIPNIDVKFDTNGNKLTLTSTSATPIPTEDYYVAVIESGKIESQRLKLSVVAFENMSTRVTWATPADQSAGNTPLGTGHGVALTTPAPTDPPDGVTEVKVNITNLPFHFRPAINTESQPEFGLWYGVIVKAPAGITAGSVKFGWSAGDGTSPAANTDRTLVKGDIINKGGRTNDTVINDNNYYFVLYVNHHIASSGGYFTVDWGGGYPLEKFKLDPTITVATESQMLLASWNIEKIASKSFTLPTGKKFIIPNGNSINLGTNGKLIATGATIELNGSAYITGEGGSVQGGTIVIASNSIDASTDGKDTSNSTLHVSGTTTITDNRPASRNPLNIFTYGNATIDVTSANAVNIFAKGTDTETIKVTSGSTLGIQVHGIGNIEVTSTATNPAITTATNIYGKTNSQNLKVKSNNTVAFIEGKFDNVEVDTTDNLNVYAGVEITTLNVKNTVANILVLANTGTNTKAKITTMTVNKATGAINIFGGEIGTLTVKSAVYTVIGSEKTNPIDPAKIANLEVYSLAGTNQIVIRNGGEVTTSLKVHKVAFADSQSLTPLFTTSVAKMGANMEITVDNNSEVKGVFNAANVGAGTLLNGSKTATLQTDATYFLSTNATDSTDTNIIMRIYHNADAITIKDTP